MCLRFFKKKICPKTFGLHCIYLTNPAAMCLAGLEVCLKHKLVQVDGSMSVYHNVVTTIIWLSWDWAACLSFPDCHVQNSLQLSVMFGLLMWIHGCKSLLCNVPYFLLLSYHCMPSLSLAFHLFSLCNSKKEKQPLPQVCGSALAVVKYKQEFASHCNNESLNRHSILPNKFTLQHTDVCYFFSCW